MVYLKKVLSVLFFLSSLNAIEIAPTNFDLRSLSILVSEQCKVNILVAKDIKNFSADYFFNRKISPDILFKSFKKVVESKGLFLNDYEGFYVVESKKYIPPKKQDYSNIELTMKVIEINNEKFNSEGFKSLFKSTFDIDMKLTDLSTLATDSLFNLKLDVFLNALEEKDYIKLVSEPKVVIANRKSTTMSVGDTRSVLVSFLSDDTDSDGNVRNTYEQKDVGLSIKATPIILKDGWISLETQLTQETLKDYSNGLLSTAKKSINGTFNILDGGSVIIGGLKSNQDIIENNKVPLLGDLPILEHIFKYESTNTLKTSLSVYIKVRILK